VLIGALWLASAAAAADVTGPDPAGDVKAKGLTAAERAALDVVSVRVVGEPGLGVFVTATFRGNFEQRVGRGHLKTALAALVLVPKPDAGIPAGLVTAGKGPVGTVLEHTGTEAVGAVREGKTVTFFVAGPGFENVASVEVRTLAKAPRLRGRQPAGVIDLPDVTWDDILDAATDVAALPANATLLSCSDLRALREAIRGRVADLLESFQQPVQRAPFGLVPPPEPLAPQLGRLADLLANVEVELRSERCSYPFLLGYHFTDTPLALLFYDGGASVGRIAVMVEFNLNGIVPGSYAGVITSSHDAVVQAPTVDDLTGEIEIVDPNPRPGTAGPLPDLTKLPLLDVPVPGGLLELERTFLRDPPTQTGFIFFHNDTTGANKLVSNPELSSTQLIPGANALQVSQDIFETFTVDQNGQTSVTTREELPQAPLTPNLDEAVELVQTALVYEREAIGPTSTIRVMNARAAEAAATLKKALEAVADAASAGELDAVGQAEISHRLGEARDWDRTVPLHLESTNLSPEEKKRRARNDLFRGIELKIAALGLIGAAKDARQAGK
jgi:hypothetical protein